MTLTLAPAQIPSPTTGVWWLGPLPLRGYALCILAGIAVAMWVAQRRLDARLGRGPGERGDELADLALWVVPAGIVGGRVYHLITSPAAYFGANGRPLDAVKIWNGGLGIWGAVALGALVAWWVCRRRGLSFLDVADAVAPGLLLAQAIGRWGNWFNNELYGGPTDLPWGLRIHEWDQAAGHAVRGPDGQPVVLGTFHPTFLYESLWCLLAALALVLIERRATLRRGQAAALYVMLYTAGRFWIEIMRTDEATMVLGQRINTWVSLVVFGLGLWAWLAARRQPPAPHASPPQAPAPSPQAGPRR